MPTVWQRIGSADGISWITAVVTPPVIYAINLTGSGVPLDTQFWPLTLASMVSIAALLGWLFTAKYTVLRGTVMRPRPVLTLLVIALGLVLRAWVFDVMLQQLGATASGEFWFRLVVALPVFGVSIPLTGYLVSLGRDYSRALEQARLALAELEATRESAQQVVDQHRVELEQLVRQTLDRELSTLLSEAPDRVLAQMQYTIDEVVRPLSRQLVTEIRSVAEPDLRVAQRTDWLEVARNVMAGNPVHPLIISLWISGVSLVWVLLRVGPAFALATGALTFASCTLVLQLARWMWNRYAERLSRWQRAVFYSLALALSTALMNLGANLLLPSVMHQVTSLTWLTTTGLVLGAGWSVAFVRSLRIEQQRSVHELEAVQRELHEQYVRVNTALRMQQVALGRLVHGPVQDALSAAALRLARNITATSSADQVVAELQRSIEASIRELTQVRSRENIPQLLAELQELWEGSVEIHAVLSPPVQALLEQYPASAITVAEIVREACSNAIRHGRANEIDLRITPAPTLLTVTVRDNGSGPSAQATAGVGSTVLSELCLNWSLTSANGRTLLTALVPLV